MGRGATAIGAGMAERLNGGEPTQRALGTLAAPAVSSASVFEERGETENRVAGAPEDLRPPDSRNIPTLKPHAKDPSQLPQSNRNDSAQTQTM